jgi:hypothetical protein
MLKRIFPFLTWISHYDRSTWYGDLVAGFTVGVLLIPQGMAYAMIAGMPPIYGLYAALVPQLVYALTGTSRQLAVGPVAMDSLLVAAGIGAMQLTSEQDYIAAVLFLTLLIGLFQLLLGILKMGFFVNFLSKPVISGIHICGRDFDRSWTIKAYSWGRFTAIGQNLCALGKYFWSPSGYSAPDLGHWGFSDIDNYRAKKTK